MEQERPNRKRPSCDESQPEQNHRPSRPISDEEKKAMRDALRDGTLAAARKSMTDSELKLAKVKARNNEQVASTTPVKSTKMATITTFLPSAHNGKGSSCWVVPNERSPSLLKKRLEENKVIGQSHHPSTLERPNNNEKLAARPPVKGKPFAVRTIGGKLVNAKEAAESDLETENVLERGVPKEDENQDDDNQEMTVCKWIENEVSTVTTALVQVVHIFHYCSLTF